MSALLRDPVSRHAVIFPVMLRDSPYESDSVHSLSLLAATCAEQKNRLHALTLLSEYLASGAGGRKRHLVAREMQALNDLYEAVWCELGCAFSDEVVRSAQAAVETGGALPRRAWREQECNGEQETLF